MKPDEMNLDAEIRPRSHKLPWTHFNRVPGKAFFQELVEIERKISKLFPSGAEEKLGLGDLDFNRFAQSAALTASISRANMTLIGVFGVFELGDCVKDELDCCPDVCQVVRCFDGSFAKFVQGTLPTLSARHLLAICPSLPITSSIVMSSGFTTCHIVLLLLVIYVVKIVHGYQMPLTSCLRSATLGCPPLLLRYTSSAL
jgi:hypothetical protein